MNTIQMLEQLAADKVTVRINRYNFDTIWEVDLVKDGDGVKIEVYGKDESLHNAIMTAHAKFYRVAHKGVPEFAGTLLEHHKDDGIPL